MPPQIHPNRSLQAKKATRSHYRKKQTPKQILGAPAPPRLAAGSVCRDGLAQGLPPLLLAPSCRTGSAATARPAHPSGWPQGPPLTLSPSHLSHCRWWRRRLQGRRQIRTRESAAAAQHAGLASRRQAGYAPRPPAGRQAAARSRQLPNRRPRHAAPCSPACPSPGPRCPCCPCSPGCSQAQPLLVPAPALAAPQPQLLSPTWCI